jgi:glycosyltransferase involved in cell wall biosynthesis
MLILPSTREGFGIVLVEAFACNIPCIAYSSDGVVEVIDDGLNGFLVRQRDIKTLAKKIKIMLKDKKKAESFAQHGRDKTEKHFDWDKIAAEIERFYLTLTNQTKSK